MKIGVFSNSPHLLILGLAHILKLSGSVNIISDGLYDNLLFEGKAEQQERDGVCFNTEQTCDYDLVVNPKCQCDVLIFHIRPYYREIKKGLNAENIETNKKNILLIEQPNLYLKYGKKLIQSYYTLPDPSRYLEFSLEEKDILEDYCLGITSAFSLDKLSKNYQKVLLGIYNLIHETSFTRIKQIVKKQEKIEIKNMVVGTNENENF